MSRRAPYIKPEDGDKLRSRYDDILYLNKGSGPSVIDEPERHVEQFTPLFNAVAERSGIPGGEIRVIMNHISYQPNEMIIEAMAELMFIAKISCEAPLAQYRAQKRKEDERFEKEMRRYKQEKASRDRWLASRPLQVQEAKDLFRQQWTRMMRSLRKCLEQDNFFGSMDDMDSSMVRLLASSSFGVARIHSGYAHVDWDKAEKLSDSQLLKAADYIKRKTKEFSKK